MVARATALVEKEAVQHGRAVERDARLLLELALERVEEVSPTSTPPPGKCQPET